MPDTEPEGAEDAGVRYDLAGNPLPRAARPAAASPEGLGAPSLSGVAPPGRPSEVGPPRPDFGAPAVWTPPPGYTSPPGFHSAPPVKAPVSSVSGTQLYAVLGVVVVGIIALIFALHHVKPQMVAAPTSYKPYTAPDSSFACDRPLGWQTKEDGVQGGDRASVSFEAGKADLEVDSDTTGSLMADITSSPAQTKPAVQRMHERDEQQYLDALPQYNEKDAQAFQSKFGDSRVSEWTASKGNLKLHGYRVTMLSREREISVFCLTPERNWATLMPAFQHIINSVGPSGG